MQTYANKLNVFIILRKERVLMHLSLPDVIYLVALGIYILLNINFKLTTFILQLENSKGNNNFDN